jgi:hypothetical protein
MSSLTWQKLALVEVFAKPSGIWNLAVEWIGPSRLLRFKVVNEDGSCPGAPATWNPAADVECGPDGKVPALPHNSLCSRAQYGALIGKIGGSTADLPGAETAGAPKMFAVGSYAVYSIGADSGPLFLTMNDSADNFHMHNGALWVQIDECLI